MGSRRDRKKQKQRAAERRRRKGEKRRAANSPKKAARLSPRPSKARDSGPASRKEAGLNHGFIVQRVGYNALTGGTATWERATQVLRRMTLRQVLDLSGRMSAVLRNDDGPDPETQRYLSQVCFGTQANTLWARAMATAKRPDMSVAIFDEAMLLAAVKLACVNLPTDGVDLDDPLPSFGEALLLLNDLVEPGFFAGPPALGENERLGYFRFVARLFYEQPNYLQALGRSFDLFLTDRPHLRPDRSTQAGAPYIDLPALLKQATGLDPHEYIAVGFAFLAYFYTINRASAPTTRAVIDYEHYFSQTTIPPARTAQLFDLMTQQAEQLQSEFRVTEPSNRITQFTYLPLAAKPLVRINNQVFAPFLPVVMAKLTTGLYHTLLNAYDETDRKSREAFQRYMGRVFEDYVDATMRRALGEVGGRWLTEADLRAAMSSSSRHPPICDGILVEGDAFIVIEAKAKLLSAAARSGSDETGFWAKMEELFVGPARQLSSVIDALRGGQLASLGLTVGPRTVIYPLVVHLQDLPMEPIVYEWARTRWVAAGHLQQPGVQPLQAWHIGDLEAVEPQLLRGLRLSEILRAKTSHPETVGETLINGLSLLGLGRWMQGRNAHLDSRYRRLVDESQRYLMPASQIRLTQG